ncbi:hypothetical protein ACKTEK_08090 [Tepidamorphus sp. 3E244]|uniref:hypothetical protein n=1 Tax=Tepidamorphus sp. 3E244 TaxID=3385498 RepID=UPI0038FD1188
MQRVQNFELNEKAAARRSSPFSFFWQAGRVLFEYQGRTRSLGTDLDAAESRLVLDLLRQAAPEKFRHEPA